MHTTTIPPASVKDAAEEQWDLALEDAYDIACAEAAMEGPWSTLEEVKARLGL